jgi:hypothetical protein
MPDFESSSQLIIKLVISSYLKSKGIRINNDALTALINGFFEFIYMGIIRKLSHNAIHSGHLVIIATDFSIFSFELERPPKLDLPTFISELPTMFPERGEYRRIAAPPDYSFKNTKTKAIRQDDPFQMRKRKVLQIAQVENNVWSITKGQVYNYDLSGD